jgi:hypothetical protein
MRSRASSAHRRLPADPVTDYAISYTRVPQIYPVLSGRHSGSMIRLCPARPKGPPVKKRRNASLISERVGLPALHMCSPIIHCPLWQLQWRHSPTPSPGWPPPKSYALKLVVKKWAVECCLLPGLLVLPWVHDARMQPFLRLAREHADAERSTSDDDGIVADAPP